MRVSERQRYDTVTNRIERAKTQNSSMLEQLSSQKRLNRVSDDPVGMTQSLRMRDRIGTAEQFQKNAEFAKGFLEKSESAIEQIHNNLVRAKELAVAMANDTYNASAREATAREIKEIMNSVVQLGNSTFGNRYVFGGFRTQTPPLSLDGQFLGDDGRIFLQTSRDNFQQVNLSAREMFEAGPDDLEKGHFNMMDSLDMLYRGLNDNSKDTIQSALTELEYQMDKASSFQATIGGMWNALGMASERLEKEEEMSRTSLSEIEDADIYKATSDFKRTETILQSTLMASTKLLQPSLLNFLQ
jgi:flagellar hook-associated protein 3 FlgL